MSNIVQKGSGYDELSISSGQLENRTVFECKPCNSQTVLQSRVAGIAWSTIRIPNKEVIDAAKKSNGS
jgi:hypothetical protein